MWFQKKKIFMDYASATPVLPEVKQVMEEYWSKDFYNPSAMYEEGVRVKKYIEVCRTEIARLVGAAKSGIIFTSSGTEANNLAILGTVAAAESKKPHIIISSIEHPAILEAALEVERSGGELSIVPVNGTGVVTPENILRAIKPNTVLVSVMLANNEVGTIQNVAKIGRLIREYRKKRDSSYPYLHTDASQAPAYIDTNIEKLQSDLMTLDASKIYGPKGIGLLVVRASVMLRPLILGGGQERGLRSGTENAALIAGFTRALHIVSKEREAESKRLKELQEYFVTEVGRLVPRVIVNTPPDQSLPNIVSLSVPGLLAELILLKLEKNGLLVSVGSACSSDEMTSGSPVIRALGKEELSESTLRFSFGRSTTRAEVAKAINIFAATVGHAKITA
jgi:cysteine desulfurase